MKCTCNLARILSERGMTGAQLCRMVGGNPKNFATLIRGERLPQHDTAGNVAGALGLPVFAIWPNYEDELSERRRHATAGVRKYHKDNPGPATTALRRRKRTDPSWPSQQPEYKRARQIASEMRKTSVMLSINVDPSAPDAIPLADDTYAESFVIRSARASDELLHDARWCRDQARRLHAYMVRNCAYGVYRELREVMARENRIFEERAAAVAANGREEASI